MSTKSSALRAAFHMRRANPARRGIVHDAGMPEAIPFRPHAAQKTCDEMAADRHLNGAAKTRFVKKCEKDQQTAAAKAQCDAQASQKNLHGAAR
jgi:hypothetical protein